METERIDLEGAKEHFLKRYAQWEMIEGYPT